MYVGKNFVSTSSSSLFSSILKKKNEEERKAQRVLPNAENLTNFPAHNFVSYNPFTEENLAGNNVAYESLKSSECTNDEFSRFPTYTRTPERQAKIDRRILQREEHVRLGFEIYSIRSATVV